VVKSYIVAIDSRVYKKGIEYLSQLSQANAEESQVVSEQVFDPLRTNVLASAPEHAFDSYATVSIPLSAIPSQIKVAPPPLLQTLALAEQAQPQRQGKKGKGAKNEKEPAQTSTQRGFLLKEVTWRRTRGSGDIASPRSAGLNTGVTKNLFSMPLGSPFVSDPAVFEGASVSHLVDSEVPGSVPWA